MKRGWIVASHVVLLTASLVLSLGLAWLCVGIAATLVYAPPPIHSADFPLHDTYYVIARTAAAPVLILLSIVLSVDVIAAMRLVQISGGRGRWLGAARILLFAHLAMALAALLIGSFGLFTSTIIHLYA